MTNLYIEDFLRHGLVERGLSENTAQAYKHDLEQFFTFVGSGVEIFEITSEHIRQYLAHLKLERRNSNRTIARRLSTLKIFFRYMTIDSLWRVPEDPTLPFEPIKFQKTEPNHLTHAETERLLDTCLRYGTWPERDYALFSLFLQCGCRLVEAVSLTVSDLDLRESVVTFRGTDGRRRLVPLMPRTKVALRHYLVERGQLTIPDVFVNYHKTRGLSRRGIQYILRTIVEKAGIDKPRITVHTLRYTYLVTLMDQGMDEETIQELIGHSCLTTTRNITRNITPRGRKAC